MSKKSSHYRKPDLMFLLTLFVGVGVVATSLVHADGAPRVSSLMEQDAHKSLPRQWLNSLTDLDLANRIKNWKPRIDTDGSGVMVGQLFGRQGPALRVSASVPGEVSDSLRAGGDDRIGVLNTDSPDAYIFLQKRW
jgi:hypothetical protein